MGRRERSLENCAEPLARFAADLRALRVSCGEPTYRRMASSSYFSAATLARAASGYTMPSLDVTLAYVSACDGDPADWRRRWESARHELSATAATADGPVPAEPEDGPPVSTDPDPPEPVDADAPPTVEQEGTRPRRRRLRRLVLAGGLTLSLAANGVLLYIVATRDWSANATGPVQDGTDPKANHCDDAVTLDAKPVTLRAPAVIDGRERAAGTSVGTVTLRFSHRCGGAWARFDPAPGLFSDPDEANVTIESSRPAEGAANSWRLGHIDQTYSDLLLTGMGCVQATAIVTVFNGNVTAEGSTACLPAMA